MLRISMNVLLCVLCVYRHQLFVQMVREQQGSAKADGTTERNSEVAHDGHLINKSKPAEMPCYEEDGSVPERKQRWYQ